MTQGLSHLLQSSSKRVALRVYYVTCSLRLLYAHLLLEFRYRRIVGTETGFAASTFVLLALLLVLLDASTTAATASSFFAAPACGIFPDSTSFKISLRVIRPFAPVPSTRSKSTLCSPASFNTAGEKRGFPSVGCFAFGAFSGVATSAFGSSFVFPQQLLLLLHLRLLLESHKLLHLQLTYHLHQRSTLSQYQ